MLLANFSQAQSFQPTEDYKVTATRSLVTEEILALDLDDRPNINCFVYRAASPDKHLIDIVPEEHEVFDSVQVSVLKNPGLKNVKEILRVEIEYTACCFWADISYYLITKSAELIKLPDLHQSFCDWPANIDEYYFPIQHRKGISLIQNNTIAINSEGDIDKIETNSLLLWNGKQITVPE